MDPVHPGLVSGLGLLSILCVLFVTGKKSGLLPPEAPMLSRAAPPARRGELWGGATVAFPGDRAWRWGWGEWERRPGVRAERVLALSPGNVDVAGAKAQARRVRAGHGRTRSGKGSAWTGLRQGWGGTRNKAGSPRRSPAPQPSEASQHFPTSRANAFGGAGFHGFAVSCGFAVS